MDVNVVVRAPALGGLGAVGAHDHRLQEHTVQGEDLSAVPNGQAVNLNK